jgi:cytochrome b
MRESTDVLTSEAAPAANRLRWIRVWDWPTRLFHWSLVLLITVNIYTGNVGGLREMDLHMLSGYAILALVLFRLVWGFIGSRHSQFSHFVRGPRAVIAYARSLASGVHRSFVGHNPLGGWSVVAMLLSLLIQAVTGLFSRDDILTQGPLVKHVSKQTSNMLTGIHEFNATVLYVLIAVHLAAVFGYLLVKKENLIRPMLTGRRPDLGESVSGDDAAFASGWVAALVLAAAAGIVWFVVTR